MQCFSSCICDGLCDVVGALNVCTGREWRRGMPCLYIVLTVGETLATPLWHPGLCVVVLVLAVRGAGLSCVYVEQSVAEMLLPCGTRCVVLLLFFC